jgi:3-hydroxyisobutyrate dehydrogenase
MAKNLQSKLSPSDSVHLFDINKDAMHRLAEDMRTSQAGGAVVKLAENVADATKDAVSFTLSFLPQLGLPLSTSFSMMSMFYL